MGEMVKRRPILATAGTAFGIAAVGTIGLWFAVGGTWTITPWLICWLVSINPVAFFAFGLDKRLAQREGWRIPEITLFLLASAGGSPAAYLAMRVFRHKTIKGTFLIVFWLIVIVQIVLIACLAKLAWTNTN